MRTTVTIPDALIRQIKKTTGKKRLSEALVVSLSDYLRQKMTSELFERLFPGQPGSANWDDYKIKRGRDKWS